MQYLALIAHDGKKADMVALARRRHACLSREVLVGTATTSSVLQREAGLPVTGLLSGPLGGDLQIGALVATNQVKAVIFLRDPLTAHPHEPDIAALMKICDVHNVPLATNVASAESLLHCLSQEVAPFEEAAPAPLPFAVAEKPAERKNDRGLAGVLSWSRGRGKNLSLRQTRDRRVRVGQSEAAAPVRV